MNDSNPPVAVSEPYAPLKAGDQPTLQFDKHGVIRQNHANLLAVLRVCPDWQGVVGLNEFSQIIWLYEPVPRHDGKKLNDWRPRQWTDADLAEAVEWFQLTDFPTVSADKVQMSISQFANQNGRFHPVRDFLNKLVWDDLDRLDNWLFTYCDAIAETDEQRDFVMAVGAKWMISAVARIMTPGCQADYILTLEGKQGIGKSRCFQILGGDHFSDGLPDVHTKDARDHVRGKWIIEMAELGQMYRSEIEAIKAFATRREERFRPAYGRNEIVYPRQCVFCGTTNKSEYLRDETGNRRFWPVRVTAIDIEGLEKDRNQLWAEAVERYHRKERWYLEDESIIAAAEAEQAHRYLSDAWEDPIAEYVNGKDKVKVGDVLKEALYFETKNYGRADQNRVTAILMNLGWERGKRAEKSRWWVPTTTS